MIFGDWQDGKLEQQSRISGLQIRVDQGDRDLRNIRDKRKINFYCNIRSRYFFFAKYYLLEEGGRAARVKRK